MNYGRRISLPKFKTKVKQEMYDDTSGDDKQGCKRKCRNASEKKRRDQFNCLIQELGCMVSSKNRKMDKSAVLRSTINFLKVHNDNALKSETSIKEKWKPSFLSDNEFSQLMLEALDGFLIVFSQQGHILYTSCSITSLLRHLPKDLESCTIYELVHEDDRPKIFKILSEVETNQDHEEDLVSKRFTFHCQMRRGSLLSKDLAEYELVKFHGNFTLINNEEGILPLDMGLTRYCFVATVRLQTTQLSREMATFSEQQNKFMSRHSLDWKFLFLDHRGPPIIGYLPFEVLGTSVYDYYHQDDLEKVAHCHEALIQISEGISCYYRFLTKGQEWIWLQTRNYITYNQWNCKPEFIVCMHQVVNYAEVRNDVNLSLNLTEDSRVAADKSDSGATMDSHTSTSDTCMSASISPASSIDGEHFPNKHKKTKTSLDGFQSSGSSVEVISKCGQPAHQPSSHQPTVQSRQPNSPRPHYLPPPLQSNISSPKSTCTETSSHLYSDQEVLPSSSSNISVQPAHDLNKNHLQRQQQQQQQQQLQQPQQQNSLAPELVMIQIKLQEQLVQRHQKLQDAIVQQQKELQQVQQQLLVAQQFLIQSNPFLQSIMQQSVQKPEVNHPMDENILDQILNLQSIDSETAMAVSQSAIASTSSVQATTEEPGLVTNPSSASHLTMPNTGAMAAAAFFPRMLQTSDQQQQQQQEQQQQSKVQQQQGQSQQEPHHQQLALRNQLLFQGISVDQSSSRVPMPSSAPVFQSTEALPLMQPIMSPLMNQGMASCFTTPSITTTSLSSPGLNVTGMASLDDVRFLARGGMDSSRFSLPTSAGLSRLSHTQTPSNPQLQGASNTRTSPREQQQAPFGVLPQYQMQNMSSDIDPSSMELMQQLMMPPNTQTEH